MARKMKTMDGNHAAAHASWFILHRPSDENPSSSTELIKGASNVPDGNPRKNEVLYFAMTFVAAGGKEPQQ